LCQTPKRLRLPQFGGRATWGAASQALWAGRAAGGAPNRRQFHCGRLRIGFPSLGDLHSRTRSTKSRAGAGSAWRLKKKGGPKGASGTPGLPGGGCGSNVDGGRANGSPGQFRWFGEESCPSCEIRGRAAFFILVSLNNKMGKGGRAGEREGAPFVFRMGPLSYSVPRDFFGGGTGSGLGSDFFGYGGHGGEEKTWGGPGLGLVVDQIFFFAE